MSSAAFLSKIGLASSLGLGAVMGLDIGGHVVAQSIIPDSTLESKSSVTSIPGIPIDIISGGETRGGNLFHSFEKFNVDAGRRAAFESPNGIRNILSRVTGNDRSNILGVLEVAGKANLFLINPNGISFGPNAELILRGSFVATTANAIQFGDKGLFSASNPEVPATTLTINPTALLFNQISAQSIINRSQIGLEVSPTQSLLLVGGDVELASGKLIAPGGRIDLAGVASNGVVALQTEANQLRLSLPDNVARANISLSEQALVDISLQEVPVESGSSEGNIQLWGRQVSVRDRSQILANSLGANAAGTLTVNASESVGVLEGSILSTRSQGTGATGDLTIQTGRLYVRDGSQINATNLGTGKAGNLLVIATKSVDLSGELPRTNANTNNPSGLFTSAVNGGNAGDLTIKTGQLILQDGAQISTSSNGGQGGKLSVDAQLIRLSGTAINFNPSSLFTSAANGGNAGDLTIKTGQLILQNGAQVSASGTNGGQGGKLFVDAQLIELSGTSRAGNSSGLYAVSENSARNAGELTIQTGQLIVRDGAQVSTSTNGNSQGKGGTLSIRASEFIELVGASTNSPLTGLLVGTSSFGIGGDLIIDTSKLIVQQGAIVSARTSLGLAPAGNLTIKVGELIVQDKGQISVSSGGESKAGNIEITARSLRLNNQGTITTETASGEGGNIALKARDILLRNNSNITATAGTENAGGNGGNISINTDLFVSLGNSDITANAFTGRGGNIQLRAQGLLFSSDIDITASSKFGVDGVVEVNEPDFDPRTGLVALSENLVDISQQIDTSCQPKSRQTASSFEITGRGGIPESPYESLIGDALQVDWIDLKPQAETLSSESTVAIATPTTIPEPIVEATDWVKNANGEVFLIAHAPSVTPQASWHSTQCGI